MNPIRLVVVSSALAVALLVWAQARKHEWLREEFERRVAAIESLTDFATPPIPDEQNVAAGLREVAAALKKHNEEAGRPEAVYNWDWLEYVECDPKLRAEGLKAGRKYLDSVAPIVDRLERILERPRFRTATNWSQGADAVIAELPLMFDIVKLLRGHARLAPNDKDLVRACRLSMRMGERCKVPFSMGCDISWMVAGVGEMLHAAPAFDAAFVRRELDDHMVRALPARGPPAIILKHERALFVSITRSWVAGRSVRLGFGDVEWRQRLSRRPELYRDAFRYLDLVKQYLSLCETTPTEAHSIARGIPNEWGSSQRLLFSSARSDIRNLFRDYATAVTHMRLARTALALLEARQKTGDWPATLPAPRLVDPRSGGSFTYVRGADEVRLYAANRWMDERYDWEWIVDMGDGWSWPRNG